MKAFDEVVAVLQVGTRRTTLPPIDALPELPDCTTEKRALILSGTLDLMRKAAALPTVDSMPIEVAPDEDKIVAHRSAGALAEALGANQAAAVLEWAGKARTLGKVAPPSVLPQLVALAAKHAEELLPVLGKRGLWLAELQGVEINQGADEFRRERQTNPAAYRDWLTGEMDDLDWKERVRALGALRINLSLEDQPLLETALVDRRKEVREAACETLITLDGSRVSSELSHLAHRAITIEKGLLRKNAAVNPPVPSELPKWLPRTSSRINFGQKALALFDVVRHLPPGRWQLGMTPEQVLSAVSRSDFARAIVDGLQEAAVKYGDQEWIDALFEFLYSREPISQEFWEKLAHHASENVFERTVSPKISGLGSDAGTAAWTLTLRKKPLSATTSKRVIQALCTKADDHLWLKSLATVLHPSVLELVESPYSQEPAFENTRLALLKVLDIRNRLLSSLDD